MPKIIALLAATLSVLLVVGCGGTQVRVDYDTKQDFTALRSYAWAPMTEEERQEKSRDSLTHERIQSAIAAHLAARGYTQIDEAKADFLVTHTVMIERRVQMRDTRVAIGYGRYGAGGGVGVGFSAPVDTTAYEYRVGTLIIDVIDARQKRLVWRGAGERTLEGERTPEQRIALIDATVGEILGRFPPGAKK
jgi:hypothetical protein